MVSLPPNVSSPTIDRLRNRLWSHSRRIVFVNESSIEVRVKIGHRGNEDVTKAIVSRGKGGGGSMYTEGTKVLRKKVGNGIHEGVVAESWTRNREWIRVQWDTG